MGKTLCFLERIVIIAKRLLCRPIKRVKNTISNGFQLKLNYIAGQVTAFQIATELTDSVCLIGNCK